MELEAQALRQRLDVQAARREAAGLAASLDLTKVTRYVNLIEVGALRNSETGQEDQRGCRVGTAVSLESGSDRQVEHDVAVDEKKRLLAPKPVTDVRDPAARAEDLRFV